MIAQITGQPYNEDLPALPPFIRTHLNTRHRHVTRTHLQPFLRLRQGLTYRINISANSQYYRDMPNPPVVPFIEATFHYYVDSNVPHVHVPHVQMRVHNTNLTTIQVNQIYVFDIRDFTDLRDITTPATRARFRQERTEASGAVNQMVLEHIRNSRGLTGERFPVPPYLQNLQKYGGKSKTSKNRKTRKR